MYEGESENNSKFVEVHGYDWVVKDKYCDDDHVAIHCWGMDKDSTPYLLRFNTFPAFCHIELPLIVRNRVYTWKRHDVDTFMELLNKILGDDKCRYTFVMRKKTYYYRGNRKFPMINVCFDNLSAMQKCSNILNKPLKTDNWGFIQCNVWESKIPLVRKLLTAKNVRYSQWFQVKATKVEEELRISTCKNEYIAEWETMKPIDNEICQEWCTNPRVLAFDIECYSHNHRAMPCKYESPHLAYMISCIFQRYNKPETRKRYAMIIGDCNHIPKEKLDHCELYKVNTEQELVNKFAEVIKETDPEIITGYNIFSFDYPYLDHRLKRRNHEWPEMGRIISEKSIMTSKIWKSGAYGHQSINILNMEGRISVDLLPIIKRDHKLEKYDLNTVCRHFLDKGKFDITAPEMFKIYEDMKIALNKVTAIEKEEETNVSLKTDYDHISKKQIAKEELEIAKEKTTDVMEYCIRDSELVIELMEKINVWVGLIELSNIVGTTIVELFTRGQQLRCLSQLYDLAARTGYIVDERIAPAFTFAGGFVFEPIPGLYENVICLDFASLYPSIIQAYNICYTTLVHPDDEHLVADIDCNIIEFDQEDKEIQEEEEEVLKEIGKRKKKKTPEPVMKHYKFKFYKGQEGLLPKLVRQLVAERNAVRQKLEGEKNPVIKAVLNARQLALKVSANSFFGFLGVQNGGKMPLIEGAMSITAKGRELIGIVQKHLEAKHGGRMVYGDTDSCMIDLGIKDIKECQKWGEQLSQEISGVKAGDPLPGAKDTKTEIHTVDIPGLFPPPLRMEFEKAMRLLCFKKKKYAALLIDKKGNFKKIPKRDETGKIIGYTDRYDMLKKGIVLARRDNCKFLRNTYTAILEMIMDRKGFDEAISYLVDAIQKLLNNEIDYQDLVIIRELGSNYKSESFFMKVFSEELRKACKIVNPGDRLDFLICEDPNATLLGQKMRLTDQYTASLKTDSILKIDYMYYIEKVLMNPMNQLISVGFKDIIEKLNYISYKPSNRHKPIYLTKPVQILLKLKERGYELSKFKEAVKFNYFKVTGQQPRILTIKRTPHSDSTDSSSTITTMNISEPVFPSITKPVSPSILKPISPSIPKPVSPSIPKPVSPSIPKPVSPSIPKPISPSISKPISPSITKPISPSITKPISPSITKPISPSITKPISPSITKPISPSITKPISPSITTKLFDSTPTISKMSLNQTLTEPSILPSFNSGFSSSTLHNHTSQNDSIICNPLILPRITKSTSCYANTTENRAPKTINKLTPPKTFTTKQSHTNAVNQNNSAVTKLSLNIMSNKQMSNEVPLYTNHQPDLTLPNILTKTLISAKQ
jgi:DNA polymerase elongation subunit (family B)